MIGGVIEETFRPGCAPRSEYAKMLLGSAF